MELSILKLDEQRGMRKKILIKLFIFDEFKLHLINITN